MVMLIPKGMVRTYYHCEQQSASFVLNCSLGCGDVQDELSLAHLLRDYAVIPSLSVICGHTWWPWETVAEGFWAVFYSQNSSIWVRAAPDRMLLCHQFGWVINLYICGCLLMFKFLVFFVYLNHIHFLYILTDIHWFEFRWYWFQYQLYLIQVEE